MVTIKDIAKQAGVTPSTVSRVLNQSGGYSDKTRQKVLQIAAELHYQKMRRRRIWSPKLRT